MTISGTSEGAVDGGSNLQKKYFGRGPGTFVDYLTTVVAHYRDAWGITFRTLDPLNEPAPLWWKADDRKQEGCHFSQEEQDRLIRDTGLSLASNGLLTTVSAPDENSINKALEEFRDYTAGAKAQIAQINTHSYAGTQRAELRTLAESNGKRLTMSEWGSSGAVSGKKLARHIQADITDMGVVAWSIWQPVWPTLMKIDYAKQTFELTPIYYVYENYTRFIRPGYQFFAADDSSALAAFDTNDGKLTIMKQNWTDSTTDVRFDLSNFTLEQAWVVSYCSFGTEPLRATIPVRVAASGFTGSIPAQSVVTYVISGVSIREPSLKLFAAGPKKTRKAFHFTGR